MNDKGKYLSVEAPDARVKVDFLSDGYTVNLEIITHRDGTKSLNVCAIGCDDRSTILIDQTFPIPQEDKSESSANF